MLPTCVNSRVFIIERELKWEQYGRDTIWSTSIDPNRSACVAKSFCKCCRIRFDLLATIVNESRPIGAVTYSSSSSQQQTTTTEQLKHELPRHLKRGKELGSEKRASSWLSALGRLLWRPMPQIWLATDKCPQQVHLWCSFLCSPLDITRWGTSQQRYVWGMPWCLRWAITPSTDHRDTSPCHLQ